MSLYVAWMNLIKERAEESWLTDSQREVYKRILTQWGAAPFVNLHGAAGAGKTFIARLLAKHHGYIYTQDLEEAPRGAQEVIVDNARYTRPMRPAARRLGLGRVLLIARSAVNEAMPKVELELTVKDVRQFQGLLSEHCGIVFTETVPEGTDLAEIIRREVIARGERDVCRRA